MRGRTAHAEAISPASFHEPAIHSRGMVEMPQSEGELVDGLFADVEDDEEREVHHCPRCDAPLVEREAKKGPHAGRLFLACSRLPGCGYGAAHHHNHPGVLLTVSHAAL